MDVPPVVDQVTAVAMVVALVFLAGVLATSGGMRGGPVRRRVRYIEVERSAGGAPSVPGHSAAVRGSGLGRTVTSVGSGSPWTQPGAAISQLLGGVVERRRSVRAESRLPEALDALAASLRSGSPPRRAIGEAALNCPSPFDDDLALVARALDRGDPLEGSLARWSRRRPLAGVGMVVAVLSMGSRTGGDLARAVEDVASTERQRRATRSEVRALSAQARYSAGVVALAPVAFTGLAATADPGVFEFLLSTPAGWLCLAAGVSLDLVGLAWMRSITGAVS